ncbi:FHS family L-fucose permease-like MFS transporter [Wenyingzhuangia heitensis]|uniref:FHS family L-fucose permease-like MFS transporter n=1 Tax=Wenyingzhuangia heitensis TaxID=1487859 RepID=A0ABX0U5W3_9FLAO|nr:L-fucose:H+ symporter permease [Wenyingzhuangia heitensis]NIJ43749.1 FHS family L-fucose permease-like MFS transporter [Wenyingzhuangia heitensis]
MKSNKKNGSQFLVPLIIVMALMFFWNLSRNINDVLIPHLKRACQLTDFQSSLVQSSFFGAYFLVALPAGWYIQKKGYRNGMITGLLVSAFGAFLFYPAAETRIYPFFLLALFIMAAGFAILEVTASPYIAKLGKPEGASSRLSMAAAIGSVGATIAPVLASLLFLHEQDIPQATIENFSPSKLESFLSNEAALVKPPYIILGIILVAIALVVKFIKLPKIKDEQSGGKKPLLDILKFKHTLYGVGAEFFYVGAEVGIVSFIIRYAKWFQIPELTEQKSAQYITAFMALVLTGRLLGVYILKRFQPQKVLAFCSISAFIMVTMAIVTNGYFSLACLSIVGLFTSIVYPIIFSLSMKDLKEYTKTGSSVFLLGIVGGAIVPPLMGYISDTVGIKFSFIIPLICYVYLLFFAVKGHIVKIKA